MASEVEIRELTLVEVMRRAAETSQAHGFWIEADGMEVFPLFIALVHSELSEALEEWRMPDASLQARPMEAIGPIALELADVVIRVAEFSARFGIPLADAVAAKMEYNERRPMKHGGKTCLIPGGQTARCPGRIARRATRTGRAWASARCAAASPRS